MTTGPDSLKLIEIVDPDRIVEHAVDLFGPDAATAVAYCAMEAHFDERREDFDFWFEVFKRLRQEPGPNLH